MIPYRRLYYNVKCTYNEVCTADGEKICMIHIGYRYSIRI